MSKVSPVRELVSEFFGTAFLLAAVVGSGIMAERLSGENTGLALLANAIATGGALVALILTFGPISGAHFNPVVTLSAAFSKGIPWIKVPGYLVAQVLGALVGAGVANLMFGFPVYFASTRERSGGSQFLGEFVATFGLMAVILGCSRRRAGLVPFAVAAYIVGAYWFTSSTSFANPAVTLARSASDTFAGIRPADVPLFMLAQLSGAAAATLLFRWLAPSSHVVASEMLVPHPENSKL